MGLLQELSCVNSNNGMIFDTTNFIIGKYSSAFMKLLKILVGIMY